MRTDLPTHYSLKDDLNKTKVRIMSNRNCPSSQTDKGCSFITPPPSTTGESADLRLLEDFSPTDSGGKRYKVQNAGKDSKRVKKRLKYPFMTTYIDSNSPLNNVSGDRKDARRIYHSGPTRCAKAIERSVVIVFGLFFVSFGLMQVPVGAKMIGARYDFLNYYFLWAIGLVILAGIGTIVITFTIESHKRKYATLSTIASLVFILSLGNLVLLRLGKPERDPLGNVYFLNLKDGINFHPSKLSHDDTEDQIANLNVTEGNVGASNQTQFTNPEPQILANSTTNSIMNGNETDSELYARPGFVPASDENDDVIDFFVPVTGEYKGKAYERPHTTSLYNNGTYGNNNNLTSSWELIFPPYLLGTLGTSLAMVAALIAFQCMMFLLIRKPKYEVYTLVDPSFYDTTFVLRRSLSNSETSQRLRDPHLVDYSSHF